MFEFQSCECGKTHRMLACVNVARFTVKGDRGDESIAGTTYCSSPLCFLPKSSCLGWGQQGMPKSKKNMLDSRWNAESKLYRRHICSRMLAGTRVQWCAGKYLTNESPGNKNFCFVMGANFHSINTPTVVNFKPPTWPYSMQIWEETWSWFRDTRAWPFAPPSPHAPLKWALCRVIGKWPASVSEGKWQINPLDIFAHTGSFTSNIFLYLSSALLLLQVVEKFSLVPNVKC